MNIDKEQRVTFAILCAKEMCDDVKWNAWADKWLNNEDRTSISAAKIIRQMEQELHTMVAIAAAEAAYYDTWLAETQDRVGKLVNFVVATTELFIDTEEVKQKLKDYPK